MFPRSPGRRLPSLEAVTETASRRPKRRPAAGDVLLAETEACWALLASGIARCHRELPLGELQLAARHVVELLVFLRLCEARGLFSRAGLDSLIEGRGTDRPLSDLPRLAERGLGPGLFRGDASDGRGSPGQSGLADVRIHPQALRAVVSRLSDLGLARDPGTCRPELLGAIHERLLGRRLRPEADGRFRIARSPETRKNGGVYYTPEYVTGYIVSQAVGQRLGDRPSGSAGRLDLEILDPACGCGSFLLAACRCLVAWSRRHGVPDPARHVAGKLHGVDLDPDAVLAARRSLWLEMMGGEPAGQDGLRQTGQQPVSRHLVDVLAANVRCGDVLTDSAPDLHDGRFDVVIGNPPYRRERNSKHLLDRIAAMPFGRRYRTPRMNLSYYFVHRSLELVKPGGTVSFIVGSYWTSGQGAEKLHRVLRESAHVEEIFLLDGLKVFDGVSGRHMILRVTKGAGRGPTTIKRPGATSHVDAEPFVRGTAPVVVFQKDRDQLFRGGRIDVEPACDELLAKLARGTPLGALGKVRQGIAENPANVTRKTNERHGSLWEPGEGVFAVTHEELARLDLPARERRLIRPYHDLGDLGRYFLAGEPSLALIYTTARTCPEIDRYPAVGAHLARFRPIMEARRETRRGTRRWWQLHWPREESLWRSPKIVALQMAARPAFVPAAEPVYVPFSANVFVPRADTREHLYYLTALLNSRLMWKWYSHHAKRRGVGLEINGHVLAQTPIRRIDFSSPEEKSRHDRLVALVERMLRQQRRLRKAREDERAEVTERIARVDHQIDALVYELYRLEKGDILLFGGSGNEEK